MHRLAATCQAYLLPPPPPAVAVSCVAFASLCLLLQLHPLCISINMLRCPVSCTLQAE